MDFTSDSETFKKFRNFRITIKFKVMGLIVKSTEDFKIHLAGTDIVLPEVYVRFEYATRQDGKNVEVAAYTYVSKEAYLEGKMVHTDITNLQFRAVLEDDMESTPEVLHSFLTQVVSQQGLATERRNKSEVLSMENKSKIEDKPETM